MSMLAIALVGFGLHAAPTPEYQKILDRAPPKKACEETKARFEKWAPHDAPVAPPEQVEAAMSALEKITHPTEADLALIRAEITRNFAAAYVPYIPVGGNYCTAMRLGLGRMIMKAAEANPKLRLNLAPRLRALIMKPNFETLLDAMINLVLLEFGIDHGVWTAPEGVRAQVKALRTEARAETLAFAKLYDKAFNASNLGDGTASAAAVKKLDSSPQRDLIKTGVLREMTKSADFLARERAIAERLD